MRSVDARLNRIETEMARRRGSAGQGVIGFAFHAGADLHEQISTARAHLAKFDAEHAGNVAVYVANFTGQRIEL